MGSKILRRYDRPQTPFGRLKASGKIEPAKIAERFVSYPEVASVAATIVSDQRYG